MSSWLPCLSAAVFVLLGASLKADIESEAEWKVAEGSAVSLDPTELGRAREYALTGGGSGMVIHRGRVVSAWGDTRMRYDLKSTTKSFGAAALGLAIKDGLVGLEDKALQYHLEFGTPPAENVEKGWLNEITLLHLASQTAGFEKPGGFTGLLFRPGTKWDYSDSGPNWLAECLTLVCRRDVAEVMFERLFRPIGIEREDLVWRKNAYRPEVINGITRREFGAGISANVEAMARFGYLHLKGGRWGNREILPREYIEMAGKPIPSSVRLPVLHSEEYGDASRHYGLLWWNNGDGTLAGVPRDAYWSWGLYDSLILVVPSLDLVVARAGRSWKRTRGAHHYDVLKPFFEPLVAAARKTTRP